MKACMVSGYLLLVEQTVFVSSSLNCSGCIPVCASSVISCSRARIRFLSATLVFCAWWARLSERWWAALLLIPCRSSRMCIPQFPSFPSADGSHFPLCCSTSTYYYTRRDAAKKHRGASCLWAEARTVRIPGLCFLCAQEEEEEAPTGDASNSAAR